ncbi:MAG: transposase [Janthinobacterium lividum]
MPPCDAGLILSLPGVGPAVAAALLTEASRPIRERDYRSLRCYAGTAPVTRQSGKRRTIGMRHACNARLRNAVFHWATSSLCCDSRSRRQYDALRAAGHLHARALRGLADRLLGVLIALLKTQKHFDKARRDGTFAKNPLVVAPA